MKARSIWLAVAIVAVGVAAIYLVNRYSEDSKREAYIYRCNEEGATGAMFTSRQYCEDLYNRGVPLDPPACGTAACGNGT